MGMTYYEFDIHYKGKKIDRFLIKASSDCDAMDEAAQKATDLTEIKLRRIIGPDEVSHEKNQML